MKQFTIVDADTDEENYFKSLFFLKKNIFFIIYLWQKKTCGIVDLMTEIVPPPSRAVVLNLFGSLDP